jgi:addiction module HigA family antidote
MPQTFAVHPGDILLTEFIEPLGLTAYRLAKELRVPLPRINDIIADSAIRLGIYLGLPAQFWLNLQNDYDIRLAQANLTACVRPRLAA